MRMYEPAWLQLKTKGKVRLAAPPGLHRRIVKAITKEKDMDLGFKMDMLGKFLRVYLQHRSENGVIHLWLEYKYTFLPSVKVTDL
jgi:hypothetical protein